MAEYRYTARDASGKLIKSRMEAPNLQAFYGLLKQQNLYCLDYVEKRQPQQATKLHKMRTKELIVFCRKMGTMLGSGLSMTGALEVLYSTAEKPHLRELYIHLYEDIQRGRSFSEALRNTPGCFPPFLLNMVESGEISGNIDEIMLKLAKHYQQENKLLQKVRSATTYPIILLTLAVTVIILLFTFILPSILKLFANAEIPPLTQFIMAVSNFMVNSWYIVVLALVAIVALFANTKRIPPLKRTMDKAKLCFPIVGKMNRIIYSARFSRSMAMLYASGIPLINSISLSSNILNNTRVNEAFNDVMHSVSIGESLSAAIGTAQVFDPLLPSMIRIGEESGSLDTILESISEYYDTESENAINRAISLLEPILLVVLGFIIALVLAGVLLPIYGMYSNIM